MKLELILKAELVMTPMLKIKFLVIQSTFTISNTLYLELSQYQNFYLVPSAFWLTSLIDPFGISNSAISNFHYVEGTKNVLGPFSQFSQTFQSCFRINRSVHFGYSNVNNCIEKTLFRSFFFPFFIICSGTNMPSVKGKFRVKSFGKKCQALRNREKVLFKKDIAEKYGVPRNTVSTCIKNKSKYFLHWNNHRIK